MAVYENEKEFASRGQGTAAVTLSAITTGLLALGQNGSIGGIFGGANNALAMENAQLKAEKYSDQTSEAQRQALLTNWLKPLADEAAANKVKIATLEADISKNKEIAELQIKLVEERNRTEHAQMQGAIGLIDQRLHCVEHKVDVITAIRVPNTAVCPGWGNVTVTPAAASTAAAGNT